MSIKVTPDLYPEIIDVYNKEGKAAAYDLVRKRYGIKNPTCLMKRMKNDAGLGYNPKTDRFKTDGNNEDKIFLNIEELCKNKKDMIPKSDVHAGDNARTEAMENMIHALISDRLLELSRYVLMDTVNRRILIDRTGMAGDGYQVVIN